ncbi:hypothetical protein AX768_23775 [Burkholderia sp. PAMC 28687]|uniref:hypothetical protein n=1 Tax=Burkholderia sp. PAMC 28687 TaxID=1795874 RepID=UPI000783CF78|nr:hypothetical protein [Burkholderia sp. PAMC 28687]AMM17256.1 hypothetical protein AX768_23775 [Burkholderia sp. PAMC 28687]
MIDYKELGQSYRYSMTPEQRKAAIAGITKQTLNHKATFSVVVGPKYAQKALYLTPEQFAEFNAGFSRTDTQ